MKPIINLLSAVILLSMVPLSSCTDAKSEVQGNVLSTSGNQANIRTGKPQKNQLDTEVKCRATVHVPPQSMVAIHAPLGGFAKTVRFYPGDKVSKGTLLATISGQAYIDLQQQYLETKSKLAFLEKDKQRKQQLAADKAVSEKELQQVESNWQQAKQQMEAIKARLRFAGISAEDIEKNGIASEVQLYAPIGGYITSVNVHPGVHVTPDQKLYEIIDKGHLHLELEVFPQDFGKLKKGQLVNFMLPGDTKIYKGEVYLTGQSVDPSGTIKMHAHFEEGSQANLPVGVVGEAAIQTGSEEVYTVPLEAVIREGKQCFVFVKKGGGFEKTEVEIGEEDFEKIQIRSIKGHSMDTEIAMEGAYYLNAETIEGGGHGH